MKRGRAFTTIFQLLVVLAVLLLTATVLGPVLEKSIIRARDARCASNLHAIGAALDRYLEDTPSRKYPIIPDWWMTLGNMGTIYKDPARHDVPHRPLNTYLGHTEPGSIVPEASCPADIGEYATPGSVYLARGNSYVTTIGVHFGLRGVFIPPMKEADIKPAHNKVVLSDTPIYGNRKLELPMHRWHTTEPKRLITTLFADFHVELFLFEPEYEDNKKFDPQRKYW